MKKNIIQKNKNLVIYQAKSGAIELRGDFEHETLWATQAQIAKVFGIERSVATKHIRNILKDKEILEKSNVQKMHIANSDKPVTLYGLDLILAVGYRTNSSKAIQFRRWSSRILKEYIIQGYAINREVIAKNYDGFMNAVSKVKALLPKDSSAKPDDIIELINLFADTWFSLDAYDKEKLSGKGTTKKNVAIVADHLWKDVFLLKNKLMEQNEATELFATEREGGALSGIVGNVMQSFGGQALYKTVEERAAHLLYFIIKNHPFVDGNKRTGAYAFIWYLQKAKVLNIKKLTPEALTVVTLLVAESNPDHKDKLISVVVDLIS